jgi:hypothetical protein
MRVDHRETRENVPGQQAPQRYPAGRRCTTCRVPLSIYNGDDVCWSCFDRSFVAGGASAHRRASEGPGMIGRRCARCGVEIPDDAPPADWRYVPEAGIPEQLGQTYDPLEPRGQVICAGCDT